MTTRQYLRRNEIPDVLWDLYSNWAVGEKPRGPRLWPAEIERRRNVLRAPERQPPPPALGVPPRTVTEPFTIMLWGITEQSISQWLSLGGNHDTDLTGMAASPGVAEEPARVVLSPAQIGEAQRARSSSRHSPRRAGRADLRQIKATVTDIGGIMSHAAIVCREYSLPAVTGTAVATKRITTGQRIRVDGDAGRVTILD